MAEQGDSLGCEMVLADMETTGIAPTEASYSQLVSAHVCAGDFSKAKNTIRLMATRDLEQVETAL